MLRVALKSATVEDFLQVLISRLTRYDMQISRRESIPNIYRLGHWLQAAENVRDGVRPYLNRDDGEAMTALRRALNKEFHAGDMPPVKQVLKQMDNWEQKGRTPKLAADMANRVASRFVYGYDRHALRELELYMENESSLYRQKQSIIENIKRKMKSGRYNSGLAPKLWMYWVDAGAKAYAKEHGGPGARVRDMFPKDLRMALAQEFAKDYEEQIKNGEYGDITASDHTSIDSIYASITASEEKPEDPTLAAVRQAMQMTAALKAKDKKVIDAFADEKPAEGLMLRSTGKVLEKMGMGGGTFAKWDGGKIKVVMETSARSDDSILRYMKKSIPSGRLHDHPQL